MSIETRKIVIVVKSEDGQFYHKEAVEFYDTTTNENVDPTILFEKKSLTEEKFKEMVDNAFNGI